MKSYLDKYLPSFSLWRSRRPTVAVIRLNGVIGRVGGLRQGLTLAGLASAIEKAFRQKRLTAVALSINSPGGSPVQSSLLHRRIRTLAAEKDVPVFAFVEDVGASGGYWLACAGDEIYADANSIIGSIGVVSAGFGFADAIKRLGIERRLYTAGKQKGMLDPFLAEDAKDVKHLKSLQGELHENFKGIVRESRGERLSGPEAELFSGAFWTGRQALDMGLVDGVGELRETLRDRFGDKTRFRIFGDSRKSLRRRLGLGGETVRDVPDAGDWLVRGLAAVEERLFWSRFGL